MAANAALNILRVASGSVYALSAHRSRLVLFQGASASNSKQLAAVVAIAYETAVTGAEMKELRERLGWSQQRLATKLGMRVSAISHYEQGRVNTKTGERVYVDPARELACEMLLVKHEQGEI